MVHYVLLILSLPKWIRIHRVAIIRNIQIDVNNPIILILSKAHPFKKQKTGMSLPQSRPVFDEDRPVGLEWNGEDYSCAYDTLFTTLYDIWTQKPKL